MIINNKDHLLKIINRFNNQRIMVIGDLILDKYLWCDVDRLSSEAPVPIALIRNIKYVLGGAANVANNLVDLGANVDLIGLIGDDDNGKILNKMLLAKNININGSFVSLNRQTTVKQRVMCDTNQLLRIDSEDVSKINLNEEKEILNYVNKKIKETKIIIFSDYSKGLISKKLVKDIIKLAKNNKVKVLADPTVNELSKFKNVYLVKPNRKESEIIAGEKIAENYSNLIGVGRKISSKLNSKLVITLGKDGIAIFDEKKFLHLSTFAKDVYDVSGAGDTVISALALGLASGANLKTSSIIGNYCAGVVVGKIGTATCSFDELLNKIVSL